MNGPGLSDQGIEFWTQAEGDRLAGIDPDLHTRDLFGAIEGGEHPSWTLKMQIMPFEEAKTYRFNPFNLIEVWPHGDYPLIEVGKLTLDRNPVDYHTEIEQAAFQPNNMVPGIGASPDRMLLARMFPYADAHRARLGVNYEQIPVNAPVVPVNTYSNRGFSFDPELVYIGAIFHDMGLDEQFRGSSRRFEVDSADEARRFLQGHGVPEDSIRRVWTAIALHTTPGVPEFMEPGVALVTAGVEYDVLGIGYHDVSEADWAEITALHPRPHFKRSILQAFTDGNAPKPQTTFGNVNADVLERSVPGFKRANFVDIIENSDWPE